MIQHIPQDPPDGHDEQGDYWLCPSCTGKCRSCSARTNCCYWD